MKALHKPVETIECYIAKNNPKAVAEVLYELGAPKVTSNQDLLAKIHYATEKFGMKAFEKLAEIDTPYRRLILTHHLPEEKKSNCGGCSGADGDFSNGGGDEAAIISTTIEPKKVNISNTHLMIAGAFLLGVLVIGGLVATK